MDTCNPSVEQIPPVPAALLPRWPTGRCILNQPPPPYNLSRQRTSLRSVPCARYKAGPACGHTVWIASGKPFTPSTQAIKISLTLSVTLDIKVGETSASYISLKVATVALVIPALETLVHPARHFTGGHALRIQAMDILIHGG
jgi:hypothetical protein